MRFSKCIFVFSALAFYTIIQIFILLQLESQNKIVLTTPVDSLKKINSLAAYYSIMTAFISRSSNDSCDLGLPKFVRENRCNGTHCDLITCKKLLAGDKAAQRSAAVFMKTHKWKALDDEEVFKMASNCSLLYLQGRYQRVPLRSTDSGFPLAFNILIHMNAEQFERLLQAIYRPQNVYCVHIDAKSSWMLHAAVSAVARCFDNVFIATRSQRVVYAGFTRLQADIDCMKDNLLRPPVVAWRYLFNVPGQSYPLRTPEEMVDILRVYNGSNDIEGLAEKRQINKRFRKIWEERYDLDKLVESKSTHEPPPHNISVVRGSGYGVFSRGFVEFIINDNRAKDLLEWSRFSYSPDEHYWSTLHHLYYNPHLLTPGGYKGLPESKPFMAVYVKWNPEVKCAGHWKRGVCIFGVGDLPDLVSRKEFFVNKFEMESEPLAYECMEDWYHSRVVCPENLNIDYYRRLPNVIQQ